MVNWVNPFADDTIFSFLNTNRFFGKSESPKQMAIEGCLYFIMCYENFRSIAFGLKTQSNILTSDAHYTFERHVLFCISILRRHRKYLLSNCREAWWPHTASSNAVIPHRRDETDENANFWLAASITFEVTFACIQAHTGTDHAVHGYEIPTIMIELRSILSWCNIFCLFVLHVAGTAALVNKKFGSFDHITDRLSDD